MTFPTKKLRAADPARALPPQPDQRAEDDLTLLLETSVTAAPSPFSAPVRDASGRQFVRLVTAVVAAVILAMTIAILALVHPRTASPAESGPSGCAVSGEEALLCGTFHSTDGTGELAFLTTRPYSLIFTQEAGLTMVLQGSCDTIEQAITITGSAVEIGNGGGASHGCSAAEKRDHTHLAENLYAPDITYRLHGDTLVLHFDYSHSSATFVRTTSS